MANTKITLESLQAKAGEGNVKKFNDRFPATNPLQALMDQAVDTCKGDPDAALSFASVRILQGAGVAVPDALAKETEAHLVRLGVKKAKESAS